MTESDLFLPIKKHFETMGFVVDGEVGGLDMLLKKDDEHIAIELKNDLNLKVMIQAAKRQKLFESVYVAVWSPKNLVTKTFKDKVYLINRLGIGLILVSKRTKRVNVYQEPIMHSVENYRKMNRKRKKKIVDEFDKRKIKKNVGGVTKQKILTAYKEDSLLVLDQIYNNGSMKAAEIKKETGIDRAYGIVYNNHYGWFIKEGKGMYGMSSDGKLAYDEHEPLIAEMKKDDNHENQ